jgi:hypothetical protein
MRPALIHLIGYPGAGKFTIAKEIARLAGVESRTTVKVVDNHHVNNTVFAVLDVDGHKALPPRVWDFVREVRSGVLGAIEELGPSDWSYVFTNVLFAGNPHDEAGLRSIADLAERRRSLFVPVRLHCAVDELARRIVAEDRRTRMKWMDAAGVRAQATTVPLLDVSAHVHALDLDVTDRSAAESAAAVLAHVASLGTV